MTYYPRNPIPVYGNFNPDDVYTSPAEILKHSDVDVAEVDLSTVVKKTGDTMTGVLNLNTESGLTFLTDASVQRTALTSNMVTKLNQISLIGSSNLEMTKLFFTADAGLVSQLHAFTPTHKAVCDSFSSSSTAEAVTATKPLFINDVGSLQKAAGSFYIYSNNCDLVMHTGANAFQAWVPQMLVGNADGGSIVIRGQTGFIKLRSEIQNYAFTDVNRADVIAGALYVTSNNAVNVVQNNSITANASAISNLISVTSPLSTTLSTMTVNRDLYANGLLLALGLRIQSTGAIIGSDNDTGVTNWSIKSDANDDLIISNAVSNRRIVIAPSGGEVTINSQATVNGNLTVTGSIFVPQITFSDGSVINSTAAVINNKVLTQCDLGWLIFNRSVPFEFAARKTSNGVDYSCNVGHQHAGTLLTPGGSQLFSSANAATRGGWMLGARRIRIRYEINTMLRNCQITKLKSRIHITRNYTNSSPLTDIVNTSLYQGMDIEGWVSNIRVVMAAGEMTVLMQNGYNVWISTDWDIQTSTSASGVFSCDCKMFFDEI